MQPSLQQKTPSPKSLDQKLARIQADSSCRDFILADAKDADMAFGLSAPGRSPEYHGGEARFRTLAEYRQLIREIVAQGLVDIMLMSASSNEVLTLDERLFDNSHVTPAVRANDTTDIWLAAGSGRYGQQPARPFRTATIDHIQCGKAQCADGERRLGADLGLYSVTFNNDVALDRPTLEAYKAFRLEAEDKGFRHFLEVFDPNAAAHPPADLARPSSTIMLCAPWPASRRRGRPLFLKMVYHGPAAMEALVRYDRSLVVGILGGSAAPPTTPSTCSARRKSTAPAWPSTAARSTTPNTSRASSSSCGPWPTTSCSGGGGAGLPRGLAAAGHSARTGR